MTVAPFRVHKPLVTLRFREALNFNNSGLQEVTYGGFGVAGSAV